MSRNPWWKHHGFSAFYGTKSDGLNKTLSPIRQYRNNQNVVGYTTISANQGFTFLTPTFNAISGDYSIQNITPIGDNVLGEGLETIQIVDEDGNTDEQYTWYTEDGSYGMVDAPGWYDGDYNLVDKTFDSGRAILFYNGNGDYSLQFSGQVEFDTKQFGCDEGFTSVGNCTPLSKDIQQYILSGDNVYGEGLETLQIIDQDGNTDEQYTWYTEDGSYGMVDEPGWYDGDYNKVEKPFEQGQSFLIYSGNGEIVIEIPGTNAVLAD